MKVKITVSASVFAAIIAANLGVAHILKGYENVMNFAPVMFGAFVFGSRSWLADREWNIGAAACVLCVVLLYRPVRAAGWQPSFVALAVCAAAYVFAGTFIKYSRLLEKKEEELRSKKMELDRLTQTTLSNTLSQDDALEKEIRDIRSLYDASKDLIHSLTLKEMMDRVSEVLKKIIKNNFRINLDEVHFAIIFKKEFEYYIANSFGYDEEYLRENEKQFVNFVLKNATKNREPVYIRNAGGETAEGGPGLRMTRSMIYIPFHVEQKKLLGVLFITADRPDIFDDRQFDNIKVLSNQIAISLEKVHLYEEVDKMSVTDSLTGLYVHRFFQDKLENELKRMQRYGGTLALIMGNIDHFKNINDTYGHLAGDYILKTIAVILKNHTANLDTVARYGGEEFCVILPDYDKEKAHARAVKIRKEIEKYPFKFNDIQIKVTMSMGVAAFPGDAADRRALIEKADKALYKAKDEGRNRVIRSE